MNRSLGTIFVATLIWSGGPRLAEAQDVSWSALAGALSERGFRPLEPPVTKLVVGGLVIPGHERVGTSLRRELIASVRDWTESVDSFPLPSPVKLGTVAQVASSIGSAAAMLARDARDCADAVIETQRIMIRAGRTKATRSKDQPDVFSEIANRVKASPADIEGAVVVWSVARATPEVPSCKSASARRAVFEFFNDLAVGYKAGVPGTSQSAVGDKPALEVLKLFDLGNLARNRTVRIKGFATSPNRARMAYMGRLQALGRTPETLPDAEFQQLGDSPTGPVDLWTGRFFVRVLVGPRRETITRDISLADRDQLIQISVPSARPR